MKKIITKNICVQAAHLFFIIETVPCLPKVRATTTSMLFYLTCTTIIPGRKTRFCMTTSSWCSIFWTKKTNNFGSMHRFLSLSQHMFLVNRCTYMFFQYAAFASYHRHINSRFENTHIRIIFYDYFISVL